MLIIWRSSAVLFQIFYVSKLINGQSKPLRLFWFIRSKQPGAAVLHSQKCLKVWRSVSQFLRISLTRAINWNPNRRLLSSICCSGAQVINVIKPKEELKKFKGVMTLNCSVMRYRIWTKTYQNWKEKRKATVRWLGDINFTVPRIL